MGQESHGTASRGNVKWWPSQHPRGCAQRCGREAVPDHPPFLPSWLRACNGRPSAHRLALTPIAMLVSDRAAPARYLHGCQAQIQIS